MTRLKRSARHDRTNKRRPKAMAEFAEQRSAAKLTRSVPDFVFLPNAHDQFAIDKLRSAPIGELALDLLVRNDKQLMCRLREALIEVYFKAAQSRELRKATKRQIHRSRSADKHLMQALKHLEAVSADGRDGLTRLVAGPRLDDAKGEKESDRFTAIIDGIRLDIARSSRRCSQLSTLK